MNLRSVVKRKGNSERLGGSKVQVCGHANPEGLDKGSRAPCAFPLCTDLELPHNRAELPTYRIWPVGYASRMCDLQRFLSASKKAVAQQ